MSAQVINIKSPVGRIVSGSLYKSNDKDFDGKPLVVKTGPNLGQSRTQFFFAIAVLKGVEKHWGETAWGSQIWSMGHTSFPQAAQRPDFAWKIEDGDSSVPNKRNKKPCDNEGWPGHWIIKFSGGFAPKIYQQEGSDFVPVLEVDRVKPGYFIEVNFDVTGNGNQSNPGVYLNYKLVCFRAFGAEISFGPDVNEAGFGQSALPAGASTVPTASTVPMPGTTAAPQGVVSVPSSAPAVPVMPVPGTVSAQPVAPVPVVPNPQFLQVPAVNPTASIPAVPALVPPVPAAPSSGPQMTAKAGAVTYQAFIAGGWTDANLIAQGYMTI